MRRKILVAVAVVLALPVLLAAAAFALVHRIQAKNGPGPDVHARPDSIPYLAGATNERRGRILAVVTSTARFPGLDKKAGYELTELSRAYYVFTTNGYEVDIASPQGGTPPMRRDDDDMEDIDHAFLNDDVAQRKLASTLRLADIDPAHYEAVYFAGGKGAMFDFPDDPDVHRIVRDLAVRGVVGAVCHGPAALLNVTLDDGQPLVADRRVTGFTNEEELFLMKDARRRFPWLLQDRATSAGAHFVAGPVYLDNTVVDGRLVTGQNPWSTWSVAEGMVRALGHEPAPRDPSPAEGSVRILRAFHDGGIDAARRQMAAEVRPDRMLLAMHGVISVMRGRVGDAFHLLRLAHAG